MNGTIEKILNDAITETQILIKIAGDLIHKKYLGYLDDKEEVLFKYLEEQGIMYTTESGLILWN